MDDFLYNLRNGNMRNDRGSRQYNQGNKRESYRRKASKDNNADYLPLLKSYLENDLQYKQRMSEIAEQMAAAEERKISAFQKIAHAITIISNINGQTEDQQETTNFYSNKPVSENAQTATTRNEIMTMITKWRDEGLTFAQIVNEFSERDIPTLSGKGKWHASTVANLLK